MLNFVPIFFSLSPAISYLLCPRSLRRSEHLSVICLFILYSFFWLFFSHCFIFIWFLLWRSEKFLISPYQIIYIDIWGIINNRVFSVHSDWCHWKRGSSKLREPNTLIVARRYAPLVGLILGSAAKIFLLPSKNGSTHFPHI